ncbi:MAG: hypothetical protein AAF462_00925 [Thermodesulfobacteriota bacterium]
MSRTVLMVAVIVVIAGYFYFRSSDKSMEIISSQQTQEQVASPGAGDSDMTEDEKLVANLITDGTITKIDKSGDVPSVYVTADYFRIPQVDKTAIMEVLLKTLHSEDPDVSSFNLVDTKSGDLVGTYDSGGFKSQ